MQDKKHTKSKKFRICLPLKLEADLKTGKKADKRQENLKSYVSISKDSCKARVSDVILYPDFGNVRFLAGGMQKSFKMNSEVNYLDGE